MRYAPASRIVAISTEMEVLATAGSTYIRSPDTLR